MVSKSVEVPRALEIDLLLLILETKIKMTNQFKS